jgi:hypothetical protein
MALIGLSVGLAVLLRAVRAPGRTRRAADVLVGVELAQGVIGYVQYFTSLPTALVELHMLGAALIWIAVLRLALSLRHRPATPDAPGPARIPQGHGVADVSGRTGSSQGRGVADVSGQARSTQGREVPQASPGRCPQREQPQRTEGPDTTATAPLGR